MDKQTIINRLEALDLSQYPYFEIRELIREFGKVGFIIFTLHPGKTITRARCDGNLKTVSDLSYKPQQYNKQCQNLLDLPPVLYFIVTVRKVGEINRIHQFI